MGAAATFLLFLSIPLFVSYFSLGDNNIGDSGAQFLAEAVKSNTSLKELKCVQPLLVLSTVSSLHLFASSFSLGQNLIGDTGAQSLAEGMKSNTSLKELK